MHPEPPPQTTGLKQPSPESAAGVAYTRIGQACVTCRRKKIKCDGRSPCHNCSSRDAGCEYPGSNDRASASRHFANSFEERCQQLDTFCHRLESLSSQLTHSIAVMTTSLNNSNNNNNSNNSNTNGGSAMATQPPYTGSTDEELHQAAFALQSLPAQNDEVRKPRKVSFHQNSMSVTDTAGQTNNDMMYLGVIHDDGEGSDDDDDSDEDDEVSDDDAQANFSAESQEAGSNVGSLVTDSYGRLRFLGGATNHVLVEAIKGLSPGGPSSLHNSSPGQSSAATGTLNGLVQDPVTATAGAGAGAASDLEIPLFVQGKRWPEMPYLPQPEDITRPLQYIADLLVNLYFDQLHYTFPVLYKPHFMARYKQMSSSSSSSRPTAAPSGGGNGNAVDRKFLSVFFAVCACASSLLSSDGKSTAFPGLEHYQKALILHYATTGEASIERVQCLGLLAMCSGGWNTLTQSWTFAAQAVRAAQDLGMHLSSLTAVSNQPSELVRQQLSRRIWWAVYCLDRVTSICLGRPMAADDLDCHCEVPLDIEDDQLEKICQGGGGGGRSSSSSGLARISQAPGRTPPVTPMTAFLAFARLCRIGGKIQRLHSPSRLKELADPRRANRFFRSVARLQQALDKWLGSLPDEIRFSANLADRGPNLTMCVIMFIVHAGSLLNLYRSLSGTASQATLGAYGNEAVSHCVSAARSCINAAELVRELVPPSHHLAFCVHYLTLSGLVLLRMPEYPREQALPDVEKCMGFLKGLEVTWSGASKGRAIIERLLRESERFSQKPVPDYMDDQVFSWAQLPGSELFGYEALASEFLDI